MRLTPSFLRFGPAQGPSFDHPVEIIDENRTRFSSRFQRLSTTFPTSMPIVARKASHENALEKDRHQSPWATEASSKPRRSDALETVLHAGFFEDQSRIAGIAFELFAQLADEHRQVLDAMLIRRPLDGFQ
jgi:hypothetical protein